MVLSIGTGITGGLYFHGEVTLQDLPNMLANEPPQGSESQVMGVDPEGRI